MCRGHFSNSQSVKAMGSDAPARNAREGESLDTPTREAREGEESHDTPTRKSARR